MKKRFRYIIEKSGTVYYFLSLNIDLIRSECPTGCPSSFIWLPYDFYTVSN